MRKESVDTQEKDSCQLHDMDVDMGENKEELSFLRSAVSSSSGWHEPQFRCGSAGRKCSSAVVEGDGVLCTRNMCESWWGGERKEPNADEKQRKRLVDLEKSRGKLAGGRALGIERKIMEIHASKKIHAENLLKEAAVALSFGQRVAGGVATQRRANLVCR